MLVVILYSDKTRLTKIGGDKSAWPVYITLGNFSKDVRTKLSNHAFIPIAFLPIAKWADASKGKQSCHGVLSSRLFHQCMKLVLKPLEKMAVEGRMMPDAFGKV